jgi:NRAMP (natural resistance-associated macrophage protein)-like metal ion transporter
MARPLPPPRLTWRRFFELVGPACLISISFLDPGNLEVDLQAGAALGYNLLSILAVTSAMAFVMQTLCAHVTLATGYHLAELCLAEYPTTVAVALFLGAILSVVAFEVAEVVGTAFAINILFPAIPIPICMVISGLDTVLILSLQRRRAKLVTIAVESLVALLCCCVIINFFLSAPSVAGMLKGTFAPNLVSDPHTSILLGIAILGSVLMPHNLFLHSGLVKLRRQSGIEADSFAETDSPELTAAPASGPDFFASSDVPASIAEARSSLSSLAPDLGSNIVSLRTAAGYATLESAAILLGTFMINAAVICCAAAKFYPLRGNPLYQNPGLQDASSLLDNVMGSHLASYFWAIGLLSSGHAATVTGTMASQFLCEGFLSIDPRSSTISLFTRAVAIVPAVAAALAAGASGADSLVLFSQVIVSFELPFACVPLLKMCGTPQVASRIPNRRMLTVGWITFVLAVAANAWIVRDSIVALNFAAHTALSQVTIILLSFVSGCVYLAVLAYLVVTPVTMPCLYDTLGLGGLSHSSETASLLGNDGRSAPAACV